MMGNRSIQCGHCREWFLDEHQDEHPGLCCDCFVLSWFPEALDRLNQKRSDKGKPPRCRHGDRNEVAR